MNLINYYKEKKDDLYSKFLNFAKRYNESLDWNNYKQKKYYFFYDYIQKKFYISSYHYRVLGQIYFSSGKLIKEIINKYYEELIEYFKNNKRMNYENSLLNKIAKLAEENNESLDWNNENQWKWYIIYSYDTKNIYIENIRFTKSFGVIYFPSFELANEIINKYEAELIEYFEEHRYGYY